jgi:tyrosyl-tRNA synthetase
MTTFTSDFLHTLSSRGFIHQVSEPDALDALARAGRVTAYIGFDCTASSLHVGSLVQIMLLYWLQQTGHRPIALMGGGTTRVGDPSGKDESRRLLTDDMIAENLAGIRAVFAKFLAFADAPPPYPPPQAGEGLGAVMANNADWLNSLNYIDFLRDVGRHFSVNRMLAFDSVKLRLDRQQELSFLEFNYMILQAYDFVELHKRHGCVLQMGGSDQWGNIVSGIDLGRRLMNAQLFALTSPLITTSSGAKMGKTAAGAVWLNADLVSPYNYWQYWRNTEDGDVVRFLKLFTVLPLEEIARLAALRGAEINEAKKVLATEATALVHGRAAAEAAAGTARQTFEEGTLAETLPTVEVAGGDLFRGLSVLNSAVRAGLASSNGEARRLIRDGGLKVNDVTVADEKMVLTPRDPTPEGVIKLSLGKKRHVLLKYGEIRDVKLGRESGHRDARAKTSLWDIQGDNLDRGYTNLREAKYVIEQEIRGALDAMWVLYEPYADLDFRHGFARDPDSRFWEMYVGCRLVDAGKTLVPASQRGSSGGQPDICVLDAGRHIWIEAIAPDSGAPGPDQVRRPVSVNEGGGFVPMPIRQAQLRITSALWTKLQIMTRYLSQEVIGPDDVRLIAIGAGRFGLYVSEHPLPLIMSAVFPIGDEFVSIGRQTGAVVDQGYQPSFEITRQGPAVPRTAFLDEQFAAISGIVWSRIGIGNMSRSERPLTLVHNPLATIPMPRLWGVWDREFVTSKKDDHWLSQDILGT